MGGRRYSPKRRATNLARHHYGYSLWRVISSSQKNSRSTKSSSSRSEDDEFALKVLYVCIAVGIIWLLLKACSA